MIPPTQRTPILVTGGSGYLGSLAAAALLAETDEELILPVRANHDIDGVARRILDEARIFAGRADASRELRLRVEPLPEASPEEALVAAVRAQRPREIVHCAGCLDYFDEERLWRTNVALTKELLEAAESSSVERFLYMSSAFSSGYLDGSVPEELHGEPKSDPTTYTRTKRAAEHLVDASGLETRILRPSVVIGHSQSGRYTGKRYGLYQLWSGVERLLCTRWEAEFHAVAPDTPVNVVHQDAFQQAFLASRERLPAGSILHIVSDDASCPTLRELWDLWIEDILKPRSIFYYDALDEVPGSIPLRQRSLMALASTNIEIATHGWRFKSTALDGLGLGGDFTQATLESVRRCHEQFVKSSPKIQRFAHANSTGRGTAKVARPDA